MWELFPSCSKFLPNSSYDWRVLSSSSLMPLHLSMAQKLFQMGRNLVSKMRVLTCCTRWARYLTTRRSINRASIKSSFCNMSQFSLLMLYRIASYDMYFTMQNRSVIFTSPSSLIIAPDLISSLLPASFSDSAIKFPLTTNFSLSLISTWFQMMRSWRDFSRSKKDSSVVRSS